VKQNVTIPRLLLFLAEVIVFAVLGIVASSHFGLADGARITAAYLVAYLVPRTILSRTRGNTTTAGVILLVLTIALIALSYLNLLEWTSAEGYSLEIPNLKSDARGYYKWALHHYDGRVDGQHIVFKGFPVMMLALWKLLGLNVVWPQAMNMLFTLTAVVLTAITTRRLLAHRVSLPMSTLLNGSLLLTCLLTYYLLSGIIILKEASVFLAISMSGYALASMASTDDERYHPWRDILIFVVACIIMALVRTTFLYFIALGVVIIALPHWRRDWVIALGMLVVVLLSMIVGNYFAAYSFDQHADIAAGGWEMQHTYIDDQNPSRAAFRKLIGYYFLYTPWHKLFMLPLTLSLQFIAPFPWQAIGEDSIISNHIIRFSYGWYALGGIALFYYLFISWRRHENMGAWAWWPAICYAVTAYVMAGSVARYVLPFEPLFVPVVMFLICRLWEGHWRKAFKRWSIFFVILLTMTLVICLEIQYSTISRMLHTPPLVHYLKYYLYL
jgi:hypothetical protein